MDINAVTSAIAYEKTTATSKEEKLTVTDKGFSYEAKESSFSSESLAAVYEKSEVSDAKKDNGKVVKRNDKLIEQMKADLDQRKNQLRNLVEQMLHKQGKALKKNDDIWQMIRKGEVEVDPETQAQAEKDIAEDGYWGVEQTSDRLVSFAQALSGGNKEYADQLIDAMKKGFEEATKAWGDKLPDICKNTIDAAVEKMEKWRDSDE